MEDAIANDTHRPNPLREAALQYASEFAIVRLEVNGKIPPDKRWADLATRDHDLIKSRWNGTHFNVGGLLGSLFVIEQERGCDPEVVERFWQAYPGGKPKTRAHRSAGGSIHVFQELVPEQEPPGWPHPKDDEYELQGFPGIKVKTGERGQIVLPGSRINGAVYSAINSNPFRVAPRTELEFLNDLIIRHERVGGDGPDLVDGQRYTEASPCPICGGWQSLPQGEGRRCWGFYASSGRRASCKREEHNPELAANYWHRLGPGCECGRFHCDPLPPFSNWSPLGPDRERSACPTLPEDFWETRLFLLSIRQAARARRVAPDSLLAVVLARWDCLVSPEIVLPPLVGARASLNIQVVLVGDSGAGKGVISAAAQALYPGFLSVEEVTAGSGEGLAAAFFDQTTVEDKQGKEKKIIGRVRDAVLVRIDEGEVLKKLAERSGQTTSETLRSAYSGEALGGQYVGQNRVYRVKAGTYRLALQLAIQPELAGFLLGDEAIASGNAQRLLWFSLADPNAPDQAPDFPKLLRLSPPVLPEGLGQELGVAAPVRAEIDGDRLVVLRGQSHDPRESHRNLTRLKVAALFALVEGRWRVEVEDWQIAGELVDCSARVVDWVGERLQEAGAARTRSAGLMAGAKEAAAKEVVDGVSRVAKVLYRKVKESKGGHWSKRDFTNAIASRDRKQGLLDPAIDHGSNQGWWLEDGAGWKLGPNQPKEEI